MRFLFEALDLLKSAIVEATGSPTKEDGDYILLETGDKLLYE